MIDPHAKYPPDLRSEKISTSQLELLRKTGLLEVALRVGRHDGEIWTARFGRLIDKKPSRQFGILYHDMVNAIRQ